MIQVYADDLLVYDSRLEKYDLTGLTATNSSNVGGTAEIILPTGHPGYGVFTPHKTVVTIFRDGQLRFRGRALYADDDIYLQRTITCEGEMCFLRDSINRSYNYNSTPAKIFRALMQRHNEQVDAFKRFTVGTVSPELEETARSVAFKNENPETVLQTFNKLLDQAGGYIVFTDAEDGSRAINYYAEMTHQSEQVIEFGENMLDFSRSGGTNDELATGLIPYGAKDPETKLRLTISSVNGGKDYILAEDAVAIHGTIMTAQTWDDITDPQVLLAKAWEHLNARKSYIASLELTALDLSYVDKTVDSFSVGDQVRVKSAPHGVNELFQIASISEDFLDPSQSRVSMGKEAQTLTGATVSSDSKNQNTIGATKSELSGDYSADIRRIEGSIDSKIAASEQNAAGTYATKGELTAQETAILERISQGYATKAALSQETETRESMLKQIGYEAYVGSESLDTYVRGKNVHLGTSSYPTKIYSSDKVEFHRRAYFPASNVDFGNNQGIRIAASADGNIYYVLRVDASDNCYVGNDYSKLYLRSLGDVVLYKSGATVTSDRREKNSIEELPEAYVEMLDKLTPVRFKYNGKGDKYHVGFIAQNVEEALTASGLDRDAFAGLADIDDKTMGLAYDEFIGLLFQKIRKMEKRINELERRTEK